jgi:hypothetical protein
VHEVAAQKQQKQKEKKKLYCSFPLFTKKKKTAMEQNYQSTLRNTSIPTLHFSSHCCCSALFFFSDFMEGAETHSNKSEEGQPKKGDESGGENVARVSEKQQRGAACTYIHTHADSELSGRAAKKKLK